MSNRVGILLIRSWSADHVDLEALLRDVAVEPSVERVDFEAALHAALTRKRADIVIYDPATPGLSLDVVERLVREHAPRTPLVILDGVATIAAAVHEALAAHRN